MKQVFSGEALEAVLAGGKRGRRAGSPAAHRHIAPRTSHIRTYSPLVEVNTKNVATLTQVWTYRLQSDAPAAAVPAGRGRPGRREFRGDAHRREPRDVSAGREPRRGARVGDRQGDLAVSGQRRSAFSTRRRVLAGRRQ